MSWGERQIYFGECVTEAGAPMQAIKIGCSFNPERRTSSIQAGLPFRVRLIARCEGDSFVEYALHFWCRADHIRGEYFHDTPRVRRLANRIAAHGRSSLPFCLENELPFRGSFSEQMDELAKHYAVDLAELADFIGHGTASKKTLVKGRQFNRRVAAGLVAFLAAQGHDLRRDFGVRRSVAA